MAETHVAEGPFNLAQNPFKLDEPKATRRTKTNTSSTKNKFGVLQPQEVILGLFGEYIGEDERAWSGGLVHVLGDLGFSVAASRVAINRVISRGLLSPEKEGRFAFYRATDRMRIVHEEGRRYIFSAGSTFEHDGQWTTVFSKETTDGRLRGGRLSRWLSFRGFGNLQDGIWIAPGNKRQELESLFGKLGFIDTVAIFVGRFEASLEVSEIASRAWQLKKLKIMYDTLVKDIEHLSGISPDDFDLVTAFKLRTRLIEMFRQVWSQTPHISDEFIDINWRRSEATALFNELADLLNPGASAYFRGKVVTGELH